MFAARSFRLFACPYLQRGRRPISRGADPASRAAISGCVFLRRSRFESKVAQESLTREFRILEF